MVISARQPVSVGLRWTFVFLAGLFCFCYPVAVIGVAFDVKPSFSLDWAGSFLLFLEGFVLVVVAMFRYGYWRPLLAALCVIVLSYTIETLGVNSGFPFGSYSYTGVLLPPLPGSVPLSVMFAWIFIIFGTSGLLDVKRRIFEKRGMIVGMALSGALLATLLDLAIEPVAAHVVFYWEWLELGPFLYYGVPLNNFVAWFVVAFVLNILVAWMLLGRNAYSVLQYKQEYEQRVQWQGKIERMAMLAPGILFLCSLFMFGLIDLTHHYYWGTIWSLCGILIIALLGHLKPYPVFNVATK
ncbi:carotenoid biosynthesis protein [Dictyobacter arantiisoli]|uniref:Carotenoid biosynthesis protein n=1 Tax=Dictyobacter arantiisoli TaxID=2014874 RepID=A0A5A5TJS6_9CHLR|nr:carotenoid biosynthesis protein [Dictyobacter arantiisoli]GCF11144.1 hypothetical protein KDI_47080 [Dictyobacter arantiisoli]